jgi:hypothetical protein
MVRTNNSIYVGGAPSATGSQASPVVNENHIMDSVDTMNRILSKIYGITLTESERQILRTAKKLISDTSSIQITPDVRKLADDILTDLKKGKVIKNPNINSNSLEQLITTDEKLKTLLQGHNFTDFLDTMAKLQLGALVRPVQQPQDPISDKVSDAITNKLKILNELLAYPSETSTSVVYPPTDTISSQTKYLKSDDYYKLKYNKYKSKYLNN